LTEAKKYLPQKKTINIICNFKENNIIKIIINKKFRANQTPEKYLV